MAAMAATCWNEKKKKRLGTALVEKARGKSVVFSTTVQKLKNTWRKIVDAITPSNKRFLTLAA